MIADISEMRHSGRDKPFRYSTVSRDVYYFANSDPDATLVYRLHKFREEGSRLEYESSIARKADGVTMAYLATAKEAIRS
ncbi:MAG: hypothetical protein HC855_00370 [Rhizobiales bacterium]|nr:hypothetical protein [Hyphomicrobiales bacterium]